MRLEEMVKKYVITGAQYNAGLNTKFLENIDKYCQVNNAQLLILPMVGKSITEDYMHPELQTRNIIDGNLSLNNNLKISDYAIKPQQINPLTGIKRFAQGDKSFIFASPKQVLQYVANSYDTIPKAVMTTGAVTKPNYNTNMRVGKIAERDHEYGFVVAEIKDKNYFHFRQVKALKNGSFTDINGIYRDGKHFKNPQVKALVVGDLHPYDLDPVHKKVTLEQIKTYKPKAVFLHDTFNGRSISHHYYNHNIRKHEVYQEQGLNLEKELKKTLNELQDYAAVAGNANLYIVASNHDEHLYRYLDEGSFIGDKGNDLIASKLYTAALEGENPLKTGLSLVGDIPSNVVFLNRDEGFKILGYELGNHGDLGANGGRGSPRSIEEANSKSITAHGHSAFKIRDTYRVGTSTHLRLDYNRGYSNWSQTNALLYGIGTVGLLNTIKGRWHC